MRGDVPIKVPVPTGGWNRAVPRQDLPPNYLRDGLNLIVDLGGILSPRAGYAPLSDQPDQTGVDDKRIMQGIAFADTGGAEQIVVATLTQWFLQQSNAWIDITGLPFTSDKDTAVRLVPFGSFNNQAALYGVNGWFHDLLRRWLVGDPTSLPVTNTDTTSDPPGPMTIAANDLDVIADRLVLVNTDEANGPTPGHNPQHARWSSVLDGTSWPGSAWAPCAGIGNLIAVRRSSRTSGVIYGQTGAYSITGQASDNAGAFTLDIIESVTVGPVSPNALINIGGVHWYLGLDYHIWRCDGQSAQIMSTAIDDAIKPGAMSFSLATLRTQRPVAMYDAIGQRIWFFVAFAGQDDAHGALVWNLRTQAWEVPMFFADAITAAFVVVEQDAPTWDHPGTHGQTTLRLPIIATDTTLPVVSTQGFPNRNTPSQPPGGVVSLPSYDVETNTGELVSYLTLTAQSLMGGTRGLTFQVESPSGPVIYGNAAVPHLAGVMVVSEITWNDADMLWPNWNAIPDNNEPMIYIGAVDGIISRFGVGTTDRGKSIEYFSVWGWVSSPNPTQELQINTVDAFLLPVVGDDALLTVDVLNTPYPTGPRVQIIDHVFLGDDDQTWLFRLDETIATSAFQPGNYLGVQLSGLSAFGGVRFAGMVLYANIRLRPDRLPGVLGLDGGAGTQ